MGPRFPASLFPSRWQSEKSSPVAPTLTYFRHFLRGDLAGGEGGEDGLAVHLDAWLECRVFHVAPPGETLTQDDPEWRLPVARDEGLTRFGLFVRLRAALETSRDDGLGEGRLEALEDRLAIVVTEPLTTNETWTRIPAGELVTFVDGCPAVTASCMPQAAATA